MWFDEVRCAKGLKALGWYHEKKNEGGYGVGPNHDWASHCFTADTMVLTRYGMRRIDSLEETGEILTPCGWKQYRSPRKTGVDAPLVEVRFAGGHTVRCTPDHMFWTVSGWTSASSLQRGSLIQSSLTRSRSISLAAFTAFGQVSSIYQRVVSAFTEMFGRQLSGLFPRAVTFTTATATSSTMRSPISSAWTHRITCLKRGTKQSAALPSILPRAHARPLPNGTSLKLEGFGTAGTQRGLRGGLSGSASQKIAQCAAWNLKRWFGKAGIRKSIAPEYARPLLIESVAQLNEREDVWDITVPDGNWFTLANGAVVHNSADAFGLAAIDYEEPRAAKKLDLSNLKRAIA
jgi:hypothetical protein